ncbi:MAG: iron-sulfur cluster assembly protein [Planctomycetaceae bacterium]
MWEKLIATDKIAPGERESVFVDDIPALLVRIEDQFFVVEDVCTHDGQPLTDGPLKGQSIVCPRHGATFDLETGKALCMPATKAIRSFGVEIRDGFVWASAETRRPAKVESSDVEDSGSDFAAKSLPVQQVSSNEADVQQVVFDDGGAVKEPSSDFDFIEALKQVIDPELMVNIVDLGLVYAVLQDEENDRRVCVEMTLTSPACPAGPQIVQQAKMALERLHDVDEASITLTMTPPWSPDRMTDEAKDQLGIF